MQYADLVAKCESEIRAGRMASARRLLQKLNLGDVPRTWALPVAHVARRTGLISFAMRLLAPIVRPKKPLSHPATDKERAEYGVLLHRAGAAIESLEMLGRVNPAEAPEALLYKVYCLFGEWDHLAAVPLLKDYLHRTNNPYQAMVGELNLCSALVSARQLDEALANLNDYAARAAEQKHVRLLGNCLELRAQVHLHLRDFRSAKADLQSAADHLSDGKVFDSILVRKWSLIAEALESGDATALDRLREEAKQAFQWETVREADRFKLAVRFEAGAFDHLYFGTPHTAYRKLVCEELGREPSTGSYVWGGGKGSILDLPTGLFEGWHSKVPPMPRKRHALFSVLARDFYQGVRIGGLFSQLFPGEYFDIFSSPQRVRQQIYRARLWAEENAVPIEIAEHRGFYSLQIGRGFGIRVKAEDQSVDGWAREWQQLLMHLGSRETFTAAEASTALGLSRSGMKRLASWALERGLVMREGLGASTTYRLRIGAGPALVRKA